VFALGCGALAVDLEKVDPERWSLGAATLGEQSGYPG
jgi:hypothetical protein